MNKDEIMKHFAVYLHEWIEWAEHNAPKHAYLDTQHALCVNFYNFLKHTVYKDVKFGKIWFDIYPVIQAMFGAEFTDSVFPFGMAEYERDRLHNSYHHCEVRRGWVREYLARQA